MGYHFVAFFQDGFLFKLFESGGCLADAILQNLRDISSHVERISLVVHPDTKEKVAVLLSRFPDIRARLLVEDPILPTSVEYPGFFRKMLKDATEPPLPLLVLEPHSSFLDPDLVLGGDVYFREQQLLSLTCNSVRGWDVRFISADREAMIELMDRAWSRMDALMNPWDALSIVRPAKYNTKKLESISPKKNPNWTMDLYMGVSLYVSSFSWNWYEAYQRITRRPLREARSEHVFAAAASHRDILQNYPMQIEVELTTASSVTPIYSALHHKKEALRGRGPHMAEDVFAAIVARLADRSIPPPELILNCVTGDPLEHPGIGPWLGDLESRLPVNGLKRVVIYTYGGGLTADVSKRLMEFANGMSSKKRFGGRLQVIVRLDAVNATVYGKVRPGTAFERVMENVEGLLKARKAYCWDEETTSSLIEIAVVTTLLAETQDHIDEFMGKWPSLSTLQRTMEKQEKQALSTPAGRHRFMDTIRSQRKQYFSRSNPVDYAVIYGPSHLAGQIPITAVADYTPLKRTPCRRLTNTISILCDGQAVLCDRVLAPDSGVVAGHIRDFKSFQDLWMSPMLKTARDSHHRLAFDGHPLCSRCGDWYIPL